MRGTVVLSMMLITALALAGCSGGSSDSSGSGSGTTSKGGNGTKLPTTSKTNSTPNLPPIIKIKVTNAAGAVTNFTTISETPKTTSTLNFSAEGSMDQDKDGLSAIAITVTDLNRTFPAGVLFAAGKFTTVGYTFDHAGPVNVTVSGIDNRGDVTTIKTKVYVDLVSTATTQGLHATAPPTASTEDCKDFTNNDNTGLVDAQYETKVTFTTESGTQWVEAKTTSGKANLGLCAPDATTIAAGKNAATVTSKKGTVFQDTVGDHQYFVWVVSQDSGIPTDFNKVGMTITVHYEPQP